MKANFAVISLIIFMWGCNNDQSTKSSRIVIKKIVWPDSALYAKIQDTLRTFPFIKREQRFFDSLTNHKQGVTFTMDTFKDKIYPIAVFYVEEEKKFQKLYRFEVNPQTMEIKVNDINTGEFLSINDYYKIAPEDKN